MFIYPLIVKRQLTQYFSFLMVYANRLYVEYSLFVAYTPVCASGTVVEYLICSTENSFRTIYFGKGKLR